MIEKKEISKNLKFTFKVIRRKRDMYKKPMHIYLMPTSWNDSGYYTYCRIHIFDKEGVWFDLGGVRIAYFGQEVQESFDFDKLPESFSKLDENFFSLGTSLNYYTNLQEFDPEIKDLFLKSINDIVLNKDLQSKAFQEDVTKKSLLRDTSIVTIQNQYWRVLVRPESILSGVTTFEDIKNGVYICYVEDFCDDLKSKMRQMLGSIYHGEKGFADNDVFTYQKTVQNFLSKYNTKSPSTQKGIIGELLAHLLIPNYTELLPVSIMKNKEENSIRKGFDIVYHNQARSLWYCEVKSGGDENIEENPNQKNCSLLSAAKKDITNHSVGKRVSLWESVLIDIEFTIPNVNNRTEIRAMLNSHHPDCNERVMDRNVILCSVLYKSLDHKIDEKRLKEFKRSSTQDSNFKGLLIVSIQKETYKRVEEFLNSELKGVTY